MKESALESIYENLCIEKIKVRGKWREKCVQTSEIIEETEKILPADSLEQFNKVIDSLTDEMSESEWEHFAFGFRLGIKLGLEI